MDQNCKILIETEEMWANMLIEVLQEYEIPCAAMSVYGAGLVIRAGLQERLEIYVPDAYFEQASALTEELFAEADDEETEEA